ncbi:hypothetical protein GCM10017557_34010 [Streptomyces aurantiacus]|uniref:Bacterial transcriptional activator domain-containing protein n=2 Tax=Streptomyces aurantiacus TaxID=47760 RepID=A0A7G1P0P4_9ACTN|nr:hypothetical protein GCM10017557_34010 [Streptomyces aurantiacus]
MVARRPVPHRPRRIRRCTRLLRRTGQLLRGLGAAIALASLLAGVPWGLMHYVGWPLPGHIPTLPDVRATLLAPTSVYFLLNALACTLWPIWGLFTLDVVRAAAAEVRARPRSVRPHTDPLQAAATVLVGAIIVSLLSMRPTAPPLAGGTTSAVASVVQPAAVAGNGPAQVDTVLPTVSVLGADVPEHRPQSPMETAEVRSPRDGIHDSLWRIADRTLGDGTRWPQIYALNRGRTQSDGQALTNPNLIRPGWVLSLPRRPPHVDPPRHQGWPPSSATPSPSPSSDTSNSPTPSTSAPSDTSTPTRAPSAPSDGSHTHAPQNDPNPGIGLPTSAFVSAGLVALVAGLVFTARRRRRLRYRPGSGDRSDLATAPVVRALLAARAQADTPDADDNSNTGETASSHEFSAPTTATASQTPPAETRVIGIKNNQALAWNLARTHGLGLIGPGAYGAIRALLVSLLAEHPQLADGHADIIVPAADARRLFGEDLAGERNLERLRIVDDLDAALDTLERELLGRTRLALEPTTAADRESTPHAELVLVATPGVHAERRLQAILDNGAALGLAGILLGHWRPGGTAHVRQDGTVVAASASVADRLTAARLFTLPVSDGQALLDLLGDAESVRQSSVSRLRTTTTPPISEPEPKGSEHSSGTCNAACKKPRRRLVQRPAGSREPPPGDVSNSTASVNAERGEQVRTPPNPQVPGTPSGSRRSDAGVPDDRRVPPRSETPTADHGTSEARPSERHMSTDAPPLRLTVLGRMRLTHHQHDGDEHADLSAALAPKQREVLAYLAVHEGGARRESLTTAIWPGAPKDRPYNSFHATLSQLRRALRTATHDAHSDITIHADGHYALDRSLITVDLWQLRDALRTSRHSSDDESRRAAVESVVELYSGDLAADLSAEWLEGPRESLRRDVLDAVSTLVRILRGEPEQALALLERVRTLDPYNEAVYRDIARFQSHLGRHDAVVRTFTLLTTKLAEIDEQPSQETSALYDLLQRPQSASQKRSGRRR